jgi:antitoxin component YwqK of YwqJK toxin-antitoxin module
MIELMKPVHKYLEQTKQIKMKNIYLLFIFISVGLYAQPQSYRISPINGKDTINYVDALGKKQRKWIVFGADKPNGCYTTDGKVEEGIYTDNKKIGKWTEYFCNGNLKSRIEFQNGRPDGYAIMYNENGKISEEGTWKNNRWVGPYKLYYENGNVQHEFNFNSNGKREGDQVYRYESGEVMIKGSWVSGKENGTVTEFYQDGSVKKTVAYNNGEADVASIKEFEEPKDNKVAVTKEKEIKGAPKKGDVVVKKDEEVDPGQKKTNGPIILNGYHTTYVHKMISKQGSFTENVLMDGKAYFYDDNGILKRIAVYKEGRYVGDAPIEDNNK